jgi:hypothetical protein
MNADPIYLANVSSACVDALKEAQEMAETGDLGPDLIDLVRHARELHDIMVEELGNASRVTGEYAGGLLLEFGEKISVLEQQVLPKPKNNA